MGDPKTRRAKGAELPLLTIDSREPNGELIDGLTNPHRIRLMTYGDFSFWGYGPGDEERAHHIGIERKEINDLLGSISSGRLGGHQAPGMAKNFDVAYLLIEGEWWYDYKGDARKGKGLLGYGRQTWNAKAIEGFLNSMTVLHGLRVVRSRNAKQSAVVIDALRHWWGKPFEEHRSAGAIVETSVGDGKHMSFAKPSEFVKCVAQLKGVGADRAKKLEGRFKTIAELVEAEPGEIREVEGFGKTMAESVWRQLHG